MSLLLAGVVFLGTSGALYMSRLLARRRSLVGGAEAEVDEDDARAKKEVDAELPARNDDSTPPPANDEKKKRPASRARPTAVKASNRLEGFVCQLGDVLMRITGEEAWLAGGVVLSEDSPVAVLFVAPDAGHDTAIYVRPQPKSCLFWLEPLEPTAILVGGDMPSSVEHDGIRFDRARKLPLRPRRVGVGAPDVGDTVIVAEYVSTGSERLLVLKSTNGTVHAYRGRELEESLFEVIASGDSTLES